MVSPAVPRTARPSPGQSGQLGTSEPCASSGDSCSCSSSSSPSSCSFQCSKVMPGGKTISSGAGAERSESSQSKRSTWVSRLASPIIRKTGWPFVSKITVAGRELPSRKLICSCVVAPSQIGKLISNFCANVATFLWSWAGSVEAAINYTPFGPYSFCASTKSGISFRQGTHQVAQKFKMTILPRKSERAWVCFCRFCSCKSGGGETESAKRLRPSKIVAKAATPEIKTNRRQFSTKI